MNTEQLTQLEMSKEDIEFAERVAKRLGYTQTAYTSTSALWGLFCLRDRASQRAGVIVKTAELGTIFVQCLEDLNLCEMADEERRRERAWQKDLLQPETNPHRLDELLREDEP